MSNFAKMTFSCSYNWYFSLLDVYLLFGTGTSVIESTSISVALSAPNAVPSISIDYALAEPQHSISGALLFGGMAGKWVTRLFNKALLPTPVKDIIFVPSATKGLSDLLGYWVSIKLPFFPDTNKLDVVLKSEFLDVNGAGDSIILGLKTNITVEDRPYNKMAWKNLETEIPFKTYKYQACFSADLLVGIVEVIGKARNFILDFTGADTELATVGSLFRMMPRLAELFGPSETLYIGCRPIGSNDMVPIIDKAVNADTIRGQSAWSCMLGSKPRGVDIVEFQIFQRGNLVKKGSADSGTFTLKLGYEKPSAFFSKIGASLVPVEDYTEFSLIADKLTAFFSGAALYNNGLKFSILGGLTEGSVLNPSWEEICMAYN